MQEGWKCPQCGRIYAPWISSCLYCVGVHPYPVVPDNPYNPYNPWPYAEPYVWKWTGTTDLSAIETW